MIEPLFSFFLPFGIFCYLIVGYALFTGLIDDFSDGKSRKSSVKKLRKAKKNKTQVKDIVIERWLFFGSGFYGTAALFTYGIVEIFEVTSFVIKLLDPANWTFSVTIDLIIRLIINSVMNLVQAFTWFFYWFTDDDTMPFWIGIVIAYGVYVVTSRFAASHHRSGVGHMRLWPALGIANGASQDSTAG